MKNLITSQKATLGSLVGIFSLALTTSVASAQIVLPGGASVDLGASFGNFSDVSSTITSVVNLVLALAAIAAFFFILWGAFKYVTAGDDSSKTEAARKTITNAVIGLILVALTFVIWTIVINITGFNLDFSSSATSGGSGT